MASERQPDVGRISAEAAALVEAVTRCVIRMRKNEYRAAAHVESASRTVYAVTHMMRCGPCPSGIGFAGRTKRSEAGCRNPHTIWHEAKHNGYLEGKQNSECCRLHDEQLPCATTLASGRHTTCG
jgi:hypothetical protein